MDRDNSIIECILNSSKIDNIIGNDSLILSAIKNDVNERCIEIARTWKSIVTCFFGTDESFSQMEPPQLLSQEENEAPLKTGASKPGTLQHDLQLLKKKLKKY